tara:strand:- start:810 stop:1319 length:510 start_codon:yes stop_codon:yes gene_type:complete
MFKTKLSIVLISFLLWGCSNFEFVYNSGNIKIKNSIKEKTIFSISGDDSDIISTYLNNQIGSPKKGGASYLITVNSKKSVEGTVIEKDATASKINIEYNILYEFKNIKQNCLIIKKELKTKSTYDSKSAGYSFGSDVSEKETSTKIIKTNIDNFLNDLYLSKISLSCKK